MNTTLKAENFKLNPLKMRALVLCISIGISASACQTPEYSEADFRQKIETLMAVSPPPSQSRLEVLRSYGSEKDKAEFMNRDEFAFPGTLEDIYQASSGRPILSQGSHCPRYCRVVPCKPPYLTECGLICGPDQNCPDPQCKPGHAC
ncbi:MAG: hypothetical protein KDG50_12595 [Chromatiales bacterium]|nr:hypothetical protein [Chromatiales bacterium]